MLNRSKRAASYLILALALAIPSTAGAEVSKGDFQAPPTAARPQIWWHWLDGNITDEGARLDLQWFKDIGIGGVHLFSGGGLQSPLVPTPLPFMSPGWQATFRDATTIAQANHMDVTIGSAPGWSETGGIWVAPADAMKKYVWSETRIAGGVPFTGTLVQPDDSTGGFQGYPKSYPYKKAKTESWHAYGDSAVIAFPTPKSELVSPAYTIAGASAPVASFESITGKQKLQVPVGLDGAAKILVTYDKAATIAAISLGSDQNADVKIEVGNDVGALKTVFEGKGDTAEHPSPVQTYAFMPVIGKVVQITLVPAAPPRPLTGLGPIPVPRPPKIFALTHLKVQNSARVNRFEAKAGFESTVDFSASETPQAAPNTTVDRRAIIDLTSKMTSDGHLDWTPPAGDWTVVRFGWSLTGQTNGPAEAAATGLEVDKLDPEKVKAYMATYLDMYQKAEGKPLAEAGIRSLLTDSWEAGVQNWTPTILEQFHKYAGYDAVGYLPALAGYVVDSSEESDRFLWDFHNTLKRALADDHYGTIAAALHSQNLTYYTEAEGDTPRSIGDGFDIKAKSDIPTGEFWYRPFATAPGQPSLQADLIEAASVAHVYGKPFAASESMTVAAGRDPWAFSPEMLKPVADHIFALGINRILIHHSQHQPFVDRKPGLTMSIFGQYFDRNETWAGMAKPWVDYLARTSYLLQQGKNVADIAYFYGEDLSPTERFMDQFDSGVPQGYHFDFVNATVLANAMKVKDGDLVTPGGASYRLLYMPKFVHRLTLPTLQHISDLVAAGAVLVGDKPAGGLGLESPDADVMKLADALWGGGVTSDAGHPFGKGRVYTTDLLSAALAAIDLPADVKIDGTTAPDQILSVHRQTAASDIYFLSNQTDQSQTLSVTFRVKGRAPEFWRAEDASTTLASFSQGMTGTKVPVTMAPHDAIFVVFRRGTKLVHWQMPPTRIIDLGEIGGPWNVQFDPKFGGPGTKTFDTLKSWTESNDPGEKYYSGPATYTKSITIKPSWLLPGYHLYLNLGSVKELADVSVNGKPVATAWHAPYRVDLVGKLHPGANTLTIKVVNLWPNRLIGDKQPGAAAVAYAPTSPYSSGSPLLDSGLLGPVTLTGEYRK